MGPLTGDINLSDADSRIIGAETDARVGYALASVGDLNMDGYPDLFVGAWGDDTNGSFAGSGWVIHGPVTGEIDLADEEIFFLGEKVWRQRRYGVGQRRRCQQRRLDRPSHWCAQLRPWRCSEHRRCVFALWPTRRGARAGCSRRLHARRSHR